MNHQQQLQAQQTAWLRAVPYGGHMQRSVMVGQYNVPPGALRPEPRPWLTWALAAAGIGAVFYLVRGRR